MWCSSAEICLLGRQLSQDSEWQNPEIRAERGGHQAIKGRQRITLNTPLSYEASSATSRSMSNFDHGEVGRKTPNRWWSEGRI